VILSIRIRDREPAIPKHAKEKNSARLCRGHYSLLRSERVHRRTMAAIDVLMANLVDDGVGMRAMMFMFEKMPVHRRRVGGMNMGDDMGESVCIDKMLRRIDDRPQNIGRKLGHRANSFPERVYTLIHYEERRKPVLRN